MESDGVGAAAAGGEALASLVKSAGLQVTEGRGIFLQQEAPKDGTCTPWIASHRSWNDRACTCGTQGGEREVSLFNLFKGPVRSKLSLFLIPQRAMPGTVHFRDIEERVS